MRTTRLFTEKPLASGADVALQGSAVQHLGRALRARVGDTVTLFNGDGQEFAATINELGKREILLTLGEASSPVTESAVHTMLGLCLSQGDRFDGAVQKATDVGGGAIAPLGSDRVDFSIPKTDWQSASITGNRWPLAPASSAAGESAPGHIASAVGKLGEDHGSRGTMGTALHGCRRRHGAINGRLCAQRRRPADWPRGRADQRRSCHCH